MLTLWTQKYRLTIVDAIINKFDINFIVEFPTF